MINTMKRSSTVILMLFVALAFCACKKDPQKAKAKYLASGEAFLKQKKYGDAAVEFRNAIRMDKDYAGAYYQLAQAELAQKHFPQAFQALKKTTDLDPNRMDAQLDIGRLYLGAGDYPNALKQAKIVLDKDPNDVAALQLRGTAYIGLHDLNHAKDDFQEVITLRPNDASGYVNMALVQVGLKNRVEAEKLLKQAVSVDSKNEQAATDLANLYRMENRPKEAEQVLNQAIAINPDGKMLYLNLSTLLVAEGRKDEAEATIDKLRKQLPNSPEVAIDIGRLYSLQRQPDKAIAEFQRGLSISPKNLAIESELEEIYFSTGQTKLAAEMDQALLKEFPKDLTVRVNHGRLLMAQGDAAAAIQYLQKLAADSPESDRAHYFLAMAYWQNNDLGQAHSALIDALKVKPDLMLAIESLARLSLAQGNARDAQTYAEQLLDKSPTDPGYRLLLAEALARQATQHPESLLAAEKQIQEAQKLAPNDARVHLALAQIYSMPGNPPQRIAMAQKEYEAALQLDPQNPVLIGQYSEFMIKQNQSVIAIAKVKDYVASHSSDAKAHELLGSVYYSAKDFANAQQEFEHALQLDPSLTQVNLRLGKLFEDQGKMTEALALYQKALDQQPKSAPLATLVGNIYLKKGDLDTAEKYYSQALSSDPNFSVALANTAWVYAQQNKNLDVALGMAQKANTQMPQTASIKDTLGWVLYKKGSYDSAKPLFQESIRLDEKRIQEENRHSQPKASFFFHLGMTQIALGDKSNAKLTLQKALQLNLESPDAQTARQQLSQL
jgi:tetratricopeptide (TPR) repeat protein